MKSTYRMDTKASTRPFKTQGKALSGPVSMANKATEVNTLGAVSSLPESAYDTNVRTEINTGVVAQR